MANPQTEHGFTKIANEIMDALARTRIPGEARQVLDFVIRKTYGYHKKQDWISTSQIAEATGLHPRAVDRARDRLRSMKILTSDKIVSGKAYRIGLNKNWEEWMTPDKNVRGPLSKVSVVPLTKLSDTKDIIKESIKDKKQPTAPKCGVFFVDPVLKKALQEVYDKGVNVYQILSKFRKGLREKRVTMLGQDYRIPDSVILAACEGFKKYDCKIIKAYPWFLKVLGQELERWWVNKQDKEHDAIKAGMATTRGGDVQTVRDILEKMGALK
jgi:phage replication O-like protein O